MPGGSGKGGGRFRASMAVVEWQILPTILPTESAYMPHQKKRPSLLRALILLEPQAGIEPTYTDFQSAASRLRHCARGAICQARDCPGTLTFVSCRGKPQAPRARGGDVARVPPRKPTRTAAPTKKGDRKSTRLNSSHVKISYAVFCLKKKKRTPQKT